MFLNPRHLTITVSLGDGKEACEVGNRVERDKAATWIPAQCSRIRGLQETGGGPREFMACQVASGRSFHCSEAHEVLISARTEWGGQR